MKINMNNNKIMAIITFCLIDIIMLIIALNGPNNGYESNFFSSFPVYFWICIIFVNYLGILILLKSPFTKNGKVDWKLGFFILLFINFLILSFPFFLGYALYGRSDVLSHVGFIYDIVNLGRIGLFDFYPASHLLISNTVFLTGLDSKLIINLFNPILNVFYLLLIFLLAKTLADNKGEVMFIIAFAGTLLFTYFGSMFLPTTLSFKFMPLILFLYLNSRNPLKNQIVYSILLIITLFFITFYHPLSTIVIILIFVLFAITVFLWKNIFKKNYQYDMDSLLNAVKNVSTPLLFTLVVFLIWISTFSIFGRTIKTTSAWLFSEASSTPAQTFANKLSESNLNLIDLLTMVIQSNGHQIIYLMITAIFLLVIVLKIIKREKVKFNIIFLASCFFSFFLLTIISYIGNLTFSNPERVLVYALFFSIFLNGIMSYKWIKSQGNKKSRYISLGILSIILICSSTIGIYSSYSSVQSGSINSQLTFSELEGSNWLFTNQGTNSTIYSVNNEMKKFITNFKGDEASRQNSWPKFKSAPNHFNFTDKEHNKNFYLILTIYVEERYGNYWPDNPYFSKTELETIDDNILLDQIYSNGNFNVLINKK